MMNQRGIEYRAGYKYQLASGRSWDVGLPVDMEAHTQFITLLDGRLHIRAGYAWDGPSGPAFDTRNFMEASLVHDALYQLIRMELVPASYRKRADVILRDLAVACGMSTARAAAVYQTVRLFGAGAATPGRVKEVLRA